MMGGWEGGGGWGWGISAKDSNSFEVFAVINFDINFVILPSPISSFANI